MKVLVIGNVNGALILKIFAMMERQLKRIAALVCLLLPVKRPIGFVRSMGKFKRVSEAGMRRVERDSMK